MLQSKRSTQCRHDSRHLPQEILLTIFQLTQPATNGHIPVYQSNPSVTVGPRNPWLDDLRTKKRLTLVCKAWSSPATTVLYGEIVIRRMGQISALARTLRSSSDLAGLVRSIRIHSCVVWSDYAQRVKEELDFVLRQCTGLVSFSLHTHPNYPTSLWAGHVNDVFEERHDLMGDRIGSRDEYIGANPTWLLDSCQDHDVGSPLQERLLSGLRSLKFVFPIDGTHIDHLALILSHGIHLTSLTLSSIPEFYYEADDIAALPKLHFPVLRILEIDLTVDTACDYVCASWTMPELRTLFQTNYPPVTSDHTALLSAHGRRLTSLLVCMRVDAESVAQRAGMMHALLPRLSELCPALESLSIHFENCQLYPLPLMSPTLQDVDIICPYRAFLSREANVQMNVGWTEDAHVPALRRIRLIAGSGAAEPAMRGPSLVILQAWRSVHSEAGRGSTRSRPSQQGEHAGRAEGDADGLSEWMGTTASLCDRNGRVEGDTILRRWWAVAHNPRGIINYSPIEDIEDRDDDSYVYESASDDSDTDTESLESTDMDESADMDESVKLDESAEMDVDDSNEVPIDDGEYNCLLG